MCKGSADSDGGAPALEWSPGKDRPRVSWESPSCEMAAQNRDDYQKAVPAEAKVICATGEGNPVHELQRIPRACNPRRILFPRSAAFPTA